MYYGSVMGSYACERFGTERMRAAVARRRSTRASIFSASSRTLTEKSISQAEGWTVLACCMVASMAAIVWSWRNGAMLNYGDAIAHLHIARRVFDSRTPRFSQLGSVWLPLPHILLIPFVQNYQWWATGLAGVIPSSLAYVASCAGIYRLARRWLSPAAACARAGLLRAQSQPPLPPNHGHDGAALSLRDDLDRGLDGGVARRIGQRSQSGRSACKAASPPR